MKRLLMYLCIFKTQIIEFKKSAITVNIFVVQRMTQTNNVCKIAIFYVLYILAMHK